jgi:polyisoprenoid-binding protein YceI
MKTILLVPLLLSVPALAPAFAPAAVTMPAEHDWAVDPVHSSVVFRVKHANASWFKGTFDVVEGSVTIDRDRPDTGKVELRIPVDSLDTNDKQRDDHLKSNDFFSGKENPEITFKSTKIAKKGAALEVTGDLAFAGKTKSVTIPVEYVGEGEMQGKRVGYSTTFVVKRTDFAFGGKFGAEMLGDEITMMVDLELVEAKKK